MTSFSVFLSSYYLPLKSLHLVSMISWMAALFYLPRLFVYHSGALVGSELSNTLKTMEWRLSRIIMTPAMLLTFLFGGLLMFVPGVLGGASGWFHVKIMLVLFLTGYHGAMVSFMRRFERDERPYNERVFRFLNEVPVFLMILIVFLVVMKPF